MNMILPVSDAGPFMRENTKNGFVQKSPVHKKYLASGFPRSMCERESVNRV
jgi:hypothetical protein